MCQIIKLYSGPIKILIDIGQFPGLNSENSDAVCNLQIDLLLTPNGSQWWFFPPQFILVAAQDLISRKWINEATFFVPGQNYRIIVLWNWNQMWPLDPCFKRCVVIHYLVGFRLYVERVVLWTWYYLYLNISLWFSLFPEVDSPELHPSTV